MSIRIKFLFFIFVSVFSSFLLFIILFLAMGSILNKGYDLPKLTEISQQALNTIEEQQAVSMLGVKPILEQIHYTHPNLRLEWLASDGTTIYDTSGAFTHYDFKEIVERFINMPSNLWSESGQVSLAYSYIYQGDTYYLFLSLPSEFMKDGQIYVFIRTFNILLWYIIPLLLAFMVPYLLSIWFFSSINRRLSKLNDALNQVSFRSDAIILLDQSKDELGQLAKHYNSMVQRIRRQADEIELFETKRRRFLSNLSHDLRTPLTMVLGYAETIRNGLYKDETELRLSAKIIVQRSRYMDKLLDQLMDIARQDEDTLKPQFEIHNLSEIVRKIMIDYMLFLDDQNYTIEVDIAEVDVFAVIDAKLIERSIHNLVDNAIRYGAEEKYIGVALVEAENDVYITVKDKGCLLYTSPSPRDKRQSRMPSSA